MTSLNKRILLSEPTRFIIAFLCTPLFCLGVSSPNTSIAADSRPAWQAEWEKTVKAAEEEGTVVIYMTNAFEPVFREAFQKKYPKIKVTRVTATDTKLCQCGEREADGTQ